MAIPQYQKAVVKSQTVQLRSLQSSLATAQNDYFMANGTYPTKFAQLAVKLDNLTPGDKSILNANITGFENATDMERHNDLFEIYLTTAGNVSWFRTGPYKGCGFSVTFQTGEWSCREWATHYSGKAGSFCLQVMGTGSMSNNKNNIRYYPM